MGRLGPRSQCRYCNPNDTSSLRQTRPPSWTPSWLGDASASSDKLSRLLTRRAPGASVGTATPTTPPPCAKPARGVTLGRTRVLSTPLQPEFVDPRYSVQHRLPMSEKKDGRRSSLQPVPRDESTCVSQHKRERNADPEYSVQHPVPIVR